MRQYLLVSQDEALIEVHTRDENGWRMREVRGVDGVCELESLGLELVMAGIYEGVELAG